MTKGKKEFETHLKEKFQENSYTDVKRLEGEIKEAKVAVSHSIPKKEELEKEKEKIKRNIKDLDKEIADDIQKEKQLDMVEKMEVSSETKKVLKTIKSMGEKCQEILMLAADQMSMQEMQEITGVKSIGTVLSRLSNCRKELKGLLPA